MNSLVENIINFPVLTEAYRVAALKMVGQSSQSDELRKTG